MASEINRREFVRGSVAAAAAVGVPLALPVVGAHGPKALAEPVAPGGKPAAPGATAPGALPQGKIGDLSISRILLGGNLLTHFTHSRDLRYVYNLAQHYNTEEKILQTMATAEQHGINTLVIHTADNVMNFLKKYRRQRGGKMQWIVCPTAPIEPGLAAYTAQVQQIVDEGVDAVYLWGVRADALVAEGKMDLVAKAVDVAKAQGVPSGVGAHHLEVIAACEKQKVRCDFYIKTLHHHNYPSFKIGYDSCWCDHPEETIALMQSVGKPWIAFKVMAAGAIPPEDAFRYVFTHGADFSLAGMFDYEIAEDVQIAKRVLGSIPGRPRPWRG
jgi:hypothetical protein